jgi:hypothetical protein
MKDQGARIITQVNCFRLAGIKYITTLHYTLRSEYIGNLESLTTLDTPGHRVPPVNASH